MMETKCLFFMLQPVPVATSSFQQYIGTDDIRFDKSRRPCNRAQHDFMPDASPHPVDEAKYAPLPLYHRYPRVQNNSIIFADFGKAQVTGVGKFIDINNGILSIFNNMTNYCRSMKPAPP
jgi:hypothetical protein